jgi:hypothetical protein
MLTGTNVWCCYARPTNTSSYTHFGHPGPHGQSLLTPGVSQRASRLPIICAATPKESQSLDFLLVTQMTPEQKRIRSSSRMVEESFCSQNKHLPTLVKFTPRYEIHHKTRTKRTPIEEHSSSATATACKTLATTPLKTPNYQTLTLK